MTTAAVPPRSRAVRPLVPAATAALTAVCLVAALYVPPMIAGMSLAGVSLLYLFRKAVFNWQGALIGFVLAVMWIPLGAYAIPGVGPAVPPYAVLLLLILGALFTALMALPGFRCPPMVFSGPILLFGATLVLSVAVNIGPLAEGGLSRGVVTGLAGYVLTFASFFTVRLLLRTDQMLTWLIFTLALAAAVVGFCAGLERVTRFNIFVHLNTFLPLQPTGSIADLLRGGGARSFGSAEHPIALGVVLAMALPLTVHQCVHAPWPKAATRRRIFWTLASLLILVGMISTVSRTSVVALGVMTLLALILRPVLLPSLLVIGLPMALAASFIAPGAVMTMLNSFLDPEKLVESQYSNPGWTGSGRLADLGPSLQEASHSLWFGTGVGSRVVTGPDANALILDNQLLGILLMHGVFGLAAALAIFLLPAWSMVRFSRRAEIAGRHTDLAVAVACVCLGYPVTLFFFDGFSFEQTLLFVLILMAAGSFLITHVGGPSASRMAPRVYSQELRSGVKA
ncbi:hypothetical protein J7E83_20530 [Arthrobacter sp. ISL-48]|uniref:hypothetical protein n=1 Tax=Arthrobacter sp. ISL-48 TaxID=2819110 RepID=UPI001BE6F662|nr:hypothetical protein [Arthrobacter sp. ISL-48]MBT2534471.1 hypothetical protein [Arthrobacter sp. ISL-48]